ncbi:outer envelope pore protein 24, chloroplastic-like [Populus nigra]|uniref:outer envelope pore protein 24, chloroplastic-like n=1 Tax=Populus nigra TaxID=3691 RepID=UPI002B27C0AE|nr:outer envelope pore protein 24, chloroplastic-like [Populus nigra]
MLDGTLVLNPASKLSAYHGFDYGKCKLKYYFTHQGGTSTEPGYEVGMTSWNIAASQRFCDDNVLIVSSEKWRTELGLEWSRLSFCIGHEFTDMVFTALLTSTIRMSIGIDGEY